MKIEDFKIYQFHFGTNCIASCMCFLASKLGLKFETPPSWLKFEPVTEPGVTVMGKHGSNYRLSLSCNRKSKKLNLTNLFNSQQ